MSIQDFLNTSLDKKGATPSSLDHRAVYVLKNEKGIFQTLKNSFNLLTKENSSYDPAKGKQENSCAAPDKKLLSLSRSNLPSPSTEIISIASSTTSFSYKGKEK